MTQEATFFVYDNQIQTGTIQKVIQNTHSVTFHIRHSLGIIHAKKATSCLLLPEVGDTVAFLQVSTHECSKEVRDEFESKFYILHILERDISAGTLLLPNQAHIEQEYMTRESCNTAQQVTYANQHTHTSNTNHQNSSHSEHKTLQLYPKNTPSHLTIQSDICAIYTHQDLEIQSKSIKQCAQHINVSSHHTVLTGTTLTTRFKSLRSFCEHAVHKIKNYMGFLHKKTEQIETFMDINAKQASINIEENYRLRSKRSSLKSKENMDIDAKHINIG